MSFKTLTAPIRKRPALAVMAACLLLGTGMWLIPLKKSSAQAPAAPRAAMTVTLTSPRAQNWPVVISANGNIEAWQESLVGAEIGGYALTAVDAQIGDKVKRGQVLAQFNHESLKIELAQLQALERAGAAAIVLHSLFEEQIEQEQLDLHRHAMAGADSSGEALSYVPEPSIFHGGKLMTMPAGCAVWVRPGPTAAP